MKNSLRLSLSQNFTLTPQLQQAIKLLQLSASELQEVVQDMLEKNPLLELQQEKNSHEITNTIPQETDPPKTKT